MRQSSGIIFLLTSFLFLSGEYQQPTNLHGRGEYSPGFRIIELTPDYTGYPETLRIAVWYPASAPAEKYNYFGPVWGEVAYNASPLNNGNRFPLLLFSHGYGGCGLSSQFFCEVLASFGWIVACPDHHDKYPAVRTGTGRVKNFNRREFLSEVKNISRSEPEDRQYYLYRADEFRAALKGMLKFPLFNKIIDTEKIAAGGHSFGGFTSISLCGTISEYNDERIKALLLFSTGAAAYLFTEKELSHVNIPVMLFMGEKEINHKRGSKTMRELSEKIFNNISGPKYYLEIKGGNHFSFNIRSSKGLFSGFLGGSKEEFVVITKYSVAFLEKYVAGRGDNDILSAEKDPMLSEFIVKTSAGQ